MTNTEYAFLTSLLILLPIILRFLKRKFGTKHSHKWRRKSAERTIEKIKTFNEQQIFTYLRKIDPFVMEEVILSILDKRNDVEIYRNKKYTGDNGVDGRFNIYKENKRMKCIIQVKRYSSHISIKHLKEFAIQINVEKADKGYFIHTGKTSENSFLFAKSTGNLEIISGGKLIQFIRTGAIQT